MGSKKFLEVPKETMVRPEDEKPAKIELRPEDDESKDEVEQSQLHTVDHDMDGSPNT